MSTYELLKNPIFIGVVSSFCTYAYLVWDSKKKRKNRSKKRRVSLEIPVIVGLIACILSYAFFYLNNDISIPINLDSNFRDMNSHIIDVPEINNNVVNRAVDHVNIDTMRNRIKMSDSPNLMGVSNVMIPERPLAMPMQKKNIPEAFIALRNTK
jgi:hypothetical protein